MARESITMIKIRQILRLHNANTSSRQISQSLGLHRETISKYILLYEASGMSYKEIERYNYTQFCHYFTQWLKKDEAVMHFEHKSNDKTIDDFANNNHYYICKAMQRIHLYYRNIYKSFVGIHTYLFIVLRLDFKIVPFADNRWNKGGRNRKII